MTSHKSLAGVMRGTVVCLSLVCCAGEPSSRDDSRERRRDTAFAVVSAGEDWHGDNNNTCNHITAAGGWRGGGGVWCRRESLLSQSVAAALQYSLKPASWREQLECLINTKPASVGRCCSLARSLVARPLFALQ